MVGEASNKTCDIGELQDTLGVIIASYAYIFEPWSRVEEVNHMITFESAILEGLGRFNVDLDGKGTTYKKIFAGFRHQWKQAVEKYEPEHGGWKDSSKIASELRDSLMRIAVKEGLITLSSEMFTIQIPVMPGQTNGGAGSPASGQHTK
jgi:hypothetical protein